MIEPAGSALRRVGRLYRDAFAGLSAPVWTLSTAMLVHRAGTMVLPFLALFLRNERGLSISDTGWILSAYGAGAMLGSYAGGRLSDGIGSGATQVLSLIATGIAYLAIPRFEALPALVAAIVVASLVSEAFRPACMAAIAEHATPETRARAFALLRLAANLGMAIGPAAGGLLAMRSYEWLFVCDAVTCWLAAALLAWRLGSDRNLARRAAGRRETGGSPFADGAFLALLGLTFLTICAFFQLFTTVPVYYQERFELSEAGVGTMFALNAALIALFEMVLVHALRGAPRLPLVAAGSFLMCAGLGLMPLGSTLGWVALTVVVWTAGEMLALPFLSVVVADRAGAGRLGSFMGLYVTTFAAAFVFGPVIGGSVYERLGPDALWLGIGALGFAIGPASLLLHRPFSRARSSSPEEPDSVAPR